MDDELDLDPSLRESLTAARSALEPPPELRAKLRNRILLAVAPRPGSEPGSELGSSSAAPTRAMSPLVKALLTSVVVGAIGGLVALGSRSTQAPETPRVVPVEKPRETPPPALPTALPEVPSVVEAPRPERLPERTAVAPIVDQKPQPLSLEQELSHVRQAQVALRDGDAALALRLMDQLDLARTAGALAVERGVTRVLALCALGRQAEAEKVARTVSQEADASAYQRRLSSSCAKRAFLSAWGDESPLMSTQNEDSSGKE